MKGSLVILALLVTQARAAETIVEGQRFEAACRAGTNNLALHGTALMKVRLFFDVYAAGLYLADPGHAGRVLTQVPKRIELAYLRDIPRQIMVDAAEEYLRKNLPADRLAALRDRLDTINAWYTDVKAGDRYALTYVPGAGSELALNGKSLGRIPGDDFASAYFGIWLGDGCARPDVRDTLLQSPGHRL